MIKYLEHLKETKMKLYRMHFAETSHEYQPTSRKVAKKKSTNGVDQMVTVSTDGTLIVLEEEIKKYWE